LLSDLLTSIPGSSAQFHGGVISYSNAMKHAILGIPMEILEGEGAPGAVSEETAKQMAERMLKLADVEFAVSITGVAGPAMSEGKPVGLIYIGIAEKDKPVFVTSIQHSGTREMVKLKAVKTALFQLWSRL
jgi:nicotinamide-nucleotide amidase